MPKVSVILTSFNHAQFIGESIESVLNQSFGDFELIIWDDASADGSWEMIHTFPDRRIRSFRNSRNEGPVFGVNKAISEVATGQYIAIHHSDDVWEPDKLQQQVPVLDAHPEIGAVFTWVKIIDENGCENSDGWFNQEFRSRSKWLNSLFFIRNQLAHPSVLIRRECYHEVGGYSDFLAQAPDVDMWARLLLRHSIHVIPEELTKHRLLSDGSNTSGERIDVAIRVANEWSVVRKNYLDIDEFEKLVAIFPILDPYRNSSGYNVKFLLAMVCLKECSDRAAWRLGLEWLLELCGSEVHAKEIQCLYAFTYKDLIKLTGKFDVFAIGELAERDRQIFLLANAVKLREEEVASLIDAVTAQKLELLAHRQSLEEKDSMLALLTEDFAALRSEAALLKSSLSWKITAPLRALRRSLARPKVLIRRQLASGSEHATMLPQDPVPPKDPVQPEDASFAAFVHGHLDRAAYLEANPDVEAAGLDPVWHWLEYGMFEGRALCPDASVVIGEDCVTQIQGKGWTHYAWRGRAIAVRVVKPLKASLMRHILAQGRHEPAVLAAGALAIERLRIFDASDLRDRDGVNVARVFEAIAEPPSTVLLIPTLCVGGAEKYAADLVAELPALAQGPVLVLVTDSTSHDVQGWQSLSILAPLRAANLVFWRDICGEGYQNPTVLGRLLNALRPSQVVVVNSHIGLEVVSKFGRALSYKARLYCAYFSLGVQGLGAPYGTRYPHRTLPFAYALTDNVQMVNDLRRLWGALPGPGVVELPARVEAADEGTFLARLEARRLKAGQRSPQRRWLWVSRVESFKGTSILAKIAPTLPNDQFELFGPISGSLPDLGLTAPNIRHCGILSDIASSDFSTYDGFLFTSLFEGMPNVVLEMSQHAIPMALADVGGLRGTLSDASVMFVRHGQTVEESAANYVSALEGIGNLTTLELLVMVETARAQVLRRHSPTAYHDNVARIFSYGASDV